MTDESIFETLVKKDLPHWEGELQRFAEIIKDAEKQQERLRKLIAAGRQLAALGGAITLSNEEKKEAAPEPQRNLHPLTNQRIAEAGSRREGTWMSHIAYVLSEAPRGVTYDDLRTAIEAGPFGDRLRASDKGMYGGVAKLEASEQLVKYKGHLFHPSHLETFKEKVAAGEEEDINEQAATTRSSPMADAIVTFLNNLGEPATSRQIVDHLKGLEPFSAVVTKNKTSAYNVITRLLNRGEIGKEHGLYFPPGKGLPELSNGE